MSVVLIVVRSLTLWNGLLKMPPVRPLKRSIFSSQKGRGITTGKASQELVYRYFETQGSSRRVIDLNYPELVAFFQSKYRGTDSDHWTGYICDEPLLLESAYLNSLTQSNIRWGFFSGANQSLCELCAREATGIAVSSSNRDGGRAG